jgi:putative tryptophan/tyrosine transport system substrate-binding protein
MIARREFITLLGSAAVPWPLAARAQPGTMPVIGFMSARTPGDSAPLVAFRRALMDGGLRRGQKRRSRIPLGAGRLRSAEFMRK